MFYHTDYDERRAAMARLTELQRYVLNNLGRVIDLPYKLQIENAVRRYQLDGKDCTAQITALVVRQYVSETPKKQPIKLREVEAETPAHEAAKHCQPSLYI